MTIEQIELRRILTQMLADNGINRETIIPFVKDIINEKTEKAVKQLTAEAKLDEMVWSAIRREISEAVRSQVRDKVHQCFSTINVSIDMKDNEI